MHCNEAERRLTELESVGGSLQDDAELRKHLEQCPACAHQAEAARTMRRAFDTVRSEDPGDMPAFSWVKARIKAEAAANHSLGGMKKVMAKFSNPSSGRTRWGIGMAAALMVLAFITLIPFHYQRTVGYEVAFAGVNPALAMDEYKVQMLLSRLGVEGATVDVAECAPTCSLIISNVKSRDECQMIVQAMRKAGNVRVVSEGSPLCEPASGPLVELAGRKVFVLSDDPDPEVIQRKVAACLEGDSGEAISLWLSQCDSVMSMAVAAPAGALFDMKQCVDGAPGICTLNIAMAADGSVPDSCVKKCMMICNVGDAVPGACMDDLKRAGIDLSSLEGDIDPKTLQKLQELGFEVEVIDNGGVKTVKLIKRTDDEAATDAEAQKGSAVTPEGYALDPNFPNPFNPSTTIRFTIPQSEHVRLDVINMLGQTVRTLLDEGLSAGTHEVEWNGRSDAGEPAPSGMYLYRIEAGDFVQSRSMTLLK